ncbi:hypothetical protein IC614_08735 [Allosphingosinicella flava]|uniref:Class I SAM-dependent methyltransferase n=1 Tax=Allosphingosinicella flava TaxID=2771430 RepID=A0A7T2LLE4_9SPHN|nr:hypothetical protein [Sphingosinicella flava]QPQ54430.1 hypothetical protein IC614_08735 [Sphingosinicella flava]
MEAIAQRKLSSEQIEAFYHTEFVDDQVRDYARLMQDTNGCGVVVDIGGGCGYFARALADSIGQPVRVIDQDPQSIQACRDMAVEGRLGDALLPEVEGDEGVVCFNLILHHLVGRNELETRMLQSQAVRTWHGRSKAIFVNEYIYESFVPNASGRFIYAITGSRILSFIGRQVARFIPAFRANTFGVGVRFRSHDEWKKLFEYAGFTVASATKGRPETISLPLRLLLIKTIRRDSFRLEPAFTSLR